MSPRCGTRSSTRLPRCSVSSSATTSASRARRHEHLARHLVTVHQIGLRHEALDQLGQILALELVDDVAALPAHPAAANVEDEDRRFELVLGEGDRVGVGVVGQHDRLLLDRPPQRPDVVAQPGRPLVLLLIGGLAHLRLEPAQEAAGLAGQEVAEIVDDLAVLLDRHPADAGRRTLVDVAEKARPADLLGPLVDALLQVRAGKTRSSRSSVSRMAQAWEYGPK